MLRRILYTILFFCVLPTFLFYLGIYMLIFELQTWYFWHTAKRVTMVRTDEGWVRKEW